ncbi:MAG: aspartate aminotransferase family protein [Deltaproteobacteria bacterium]|nr:aspartate aminotransferase family protein [Deltaproteobacteria bacterium]MCL4872948.1 aspartate aminotransferase family protein [bacterium]
MSNADIIALTSKHVANTYGRFPVAIVRGEGTRVWDADGKEYLDFVSGLAVCNLGHCHPKIVAAIREQAGKLIHVSNLYHIETQSGLAKLLTENSFADRVFFCNSGAEANEAALKLSRKFFSDRGANRFRIVSMEQSFHGRTFAALAATGQKKYQSGFEPLLERFVYAPFNDIEAAKRVVDDSTAAVMVEPIQGEGGVNVPSPNYLKELKEVCKKAGALLIFDEVQVGMGRTGTLFAYENYGAAPDIMTLAKGLAGGVAIGAMLATDEVASSFVPGTHASTFGGNPLATAAGIAAVTTMINDGVLDNCKRVGAYLEGKLNALKSKYGFIKEVRGKGLILGMELAEGIKGGEIVKECLAKGLLINCVGDKVLRFIPALIVTEKEVDEMLGILEPVLSSAGNDKKKG